MPNDAKAIARVALLSPPFASLSYSLPDWLPVSSWRTGQRAAIPLGAKGVRVGVILGFEERNDEKEQGFVLKPLLWPLEKEPLFSPGYLEFVRQLALRHTTLAGEILYAAIPGGLRSAQARIRFLGNGKPRDIKVSALAGMPPEELAELGRLWAQGLAVVQKAGQSALDTEICLLKADPPWPIRPVAKQQTLVLEYLFTNGAVTRRRLFSALGGNVAQALGALVERGLVAILPEDLADPAGQPEELDPDALEADDMEAGFLALSALREAAESGRSQGYVRLTERQQAVFSSLLRKIKEGGASSELLFGITGSGKTAIYMELARHVLAGGRSVMLLAPEVALVFKLWGDAGRYLPGVQCVLAHGYQTSSVRERTFRDAAAGKEPCLIIGTRSALFLPKEDIGLIILDEEHDASFKQDEGLSYQAKELAWFRAQQNNALLLLGSATPDVKSYYAASRGEVGLHVLAERVGGGRLPDIAFVPLAGALVGESLLMPESVKALQEVAARGEQAVILLNRRGYAPSLYCLRCNKVVICPHCDIGLTYHKGRERLLCHFCGWSVPFPCSCAECGGLQFLPVGEGTEKLEENLSTLFPAGTGILRLDRDSTRRPGRMEEILGIFARKEARILVGTQMLSKGHHFPDVTLVVVADADLGLNLPDYRAAERTFQLLMQSAGRAGRGEKPGRVLVQTREPSHYCWQYLKSADYQGFFERELALRQRRKYPPFVRLALIRISFPMDYQQGPEEMAALAVRLKSLGQGLGLTVLGPAVAPLPYLKGKRRYHCLIKAQSWQPVRELYNQLVAQNKRKSLRIRLDLDPVNML